MSDNVIPFPVTQPDPDAWGPILLTPEQAAKALNIGRSKVYDLLRCGSLRSVKVGGSRRISTRAVFDYVTALETAA